MDLSKVRTVILPLGGALLISGLAGTIVYYLYKNDKDEQNELTNKSKEWSKVEVTVPINAVGVVIGRQGANIKVIQEQTGTKINFKDEEVEGKRICIIRGLEENAIQAKRLVIKAIEDLPIIEVDQIFVPVQSVGRIIGRNGDAVRNMSRCSGCKILVDREDHENISLQECPEDMKRVLLKGTREQIDSAKALLLSKLHEEKEMRQQIQASAANMAQRGRKYQDSTDLLTPPISPEPSLHQESLSIPASDCYIEAFVSAVYNATHFWVQVVGPRSIQLEKLVKDMTEYYELDNNNIEINEVDIEKITNGNIVAARFPHDSSWYRGQICQVMKDDCDPGRSQVTVYYVDFGDTETIEISSVCELRTDFLKLNFQAIECKLAYVTEMTEVSEEATDAFKELTSTAQWKVVMIKIMGYYQAGKTKIIPLVQIIDTKGATDVDVAEELVRCGLLEWSDGAPKSIPSTPSIE